jgi:hypothetical protein
MTFYLTGGLGNRLNQIANVMGPGNVIVWTQDKGNCDCKWEDLFSNTVPGLVNGDHTPAPRGAAPYHLQSRNVAAARRLAKELEPSEAVLARMPRVVVRKALYVRALHPSSPSVLLKRPFFHEYDYLATDSKAVREVNEGIPQSGFEGAQYDHGERDKNGMQWAAVDWFMLRGANLIEAHGPPFVSFTHPLHSTFLDLLRLVTNVEDK